MGLQGTADFDFRPLFREYDKVSRRGKNLRPAFAKLAPFMTADQKQNFKRQEGPEGRWPPKATSTRGRQLKRASASARRKGRKPPKRGSKKLLGKLRTAFKVTFNRRELRAESRVPWSGVHQEGGTVGHGSRIPARVHHWMSNQFLAIAEKEITDHVFGKFGRPAR